VPEFLALQRADQRDALLAAAQRSGRPAHRLEKDVDFTCGIGGIAPHLVEKTDSPWHTSLSREQKWRKTVRQRLASLVSEQLGPELASALAEQGGHRHAGDRLDPGPLGAMTDQTVRLSTTSRTWRARRVVGRLYRDGTRYSHGAARSADDESRRDVFDMRGSPRGFRGEADEI